MSGGIVAVVAEKPSMGRDIARVLGAKKRGDGYLYGNGYTVTWAIGHLVRLAEPHEIDPKWKRWRRELLPMLPSRFPLEVAKKTRDQFAVVQKVLRSPRVREVVCATDAGREGELIFRYVYEAAGSTKPVRRLWISSLTPEAIRKGFAALRPGSDFDPLAAAARGRSQADWLVGMNLTRAVTLAHGHGDELLSVGRVQTPTLAMVVARELEIRAFVPEDYLEVVATFSPEGGEGSYRGVFFRGERPTSESRRLPADGEEAARIVERAKSGQAAVEKVEAKQKRLPPPLLYDLTELQRHANRLWGWSAKKTLGVAQKLYEERKLLSYPRTDSRHLSRDVAATLPGVVEAIAGPYQGLLAPGTGELPLSRRYVDDAKVTDHHAIIPTTVSAEGKDLGADERRLYDLVCRRLLAAWHDDHVYRVTTVTTAIRSPGEDGEVVDRYTSRGTLVEEEGWKVLDLGAGKAKKKAKGKDDEEDEEQSLPKGLKEGQPQTVEDARAEKKTTRPPKRFTEATLLTAMETAGKTLDDKELEAAMRDSGLGTPATRAEIIETLLRREYVVRRGKVLEATEKGIRLIGVVHPHVKSPEMTGQWEAQLKAIERGREKLEAFMAGIERYVREVVGETFGDAGDPGMNSRATSCRPSGFEVDVPESAAPPPGDAAARPPGDESPGYISDDALRALRLKPRDPSALADKPEGRLSRCSLGIDPRVRVGGEPRQPTPPEALGDLLRDVFGFKAFRPYQEPVCRAVTEGKDALLVMPTGAGKSLCYQLPGIARAGTTLVISPLIALMEDQVAKLALVGLRAERIHSGRDRTASRQVSRAYLAGYLDFLFIAPERLSVPGFPEMLARRKPAVIAIDEAHCISHWGHDFRPDYRLLGERLPLLRPAPVIALTATATPRVQEDITVQLGIAGAGRFIHGFRRTNIAVEVVEERPADRRATVARVLEDPARRPAIVYAPSRKEADALGEELGLHLSAAAYHAGMTAATRDHVQAAFISGDLEVIVATIAFGMGVDKPDVRTVIHTGLPGTVEGYYQEIGRAGRDGLPSRAILLYSWADRRMHEFFFDRDYPELEVLERLHRCLGDDWTPKAALQTKLSDLDEEVLAKALEKLWIHRGAEIDPEENVRRGPNEGWDAAYLAQRQHRLEQLADIMRFADSSVCRMLSLVRHFGDREDSGAPCGQCDVCAPEACLVRRFREPTPTEARAASRAIALLQDWDAQGTAQLYKKSCPDEALERRSFDRVLGGLVRAGLLHLRDDSFEKDGKTIRFKRAALSVEGRRIDPRTVAFEVAEEPPKTKRRTKKAARPRKAATKKAAAKKTAAVPKKKPSPVPSGVPGDLVEELKAWRLKEAKRRRTPAFRVMTDQVILALAAERPQDEAALLRVKGIGPTQARKYGAKLLEILKP